MVGAAVGNELWGEFDGVLVGLLVGLEDEGVVDGNLVGDSEGLFVVIVGFEVGLDVVGSNVVVGDCVGSVGEPVDLVGLAEGWNVKGDFVARRFSEDLFSCLLESEWGIVMVYVLVHVLDSLLH